MRKPSISTSKEKIKISECVFSLDPYQFEEDLNKYISDMCSLRDKYKDNYHKLIFRFCEMDHEYFGPEYAFRLIGSRFETDEEFKKRMTYLKSREKQKKLTSK